MMRTHRFYFSCLTWLLLVVASMVCTGCTHEFWADNPADAQDAITRTQPAYERDTLEAYNLGPGDEINITVFREDSLSKSYSLDGKGRISMPLIGNVDLLNLTTPQAQNLIRHKLSEGYLVHPSVSVEVKTYRPFFIMGEVRTPGKYNYSTDMNIYNAVAMAGGFTYRANRAKAKIIPHKNKQNIGFQAPLKTQIRPGDVIIIPERFF